MTIKVFIADDHAIVRKGLRQILEEDKGIEVIGEAQDYPGIFTALRGLEPDVIVLDVAMPGKNGIEILKQLRRDRPGVRVLVVSMYPEDQFGLRAIKAGASGYLNKTSSPERLVEAVRQAARGRRYMSAELAEVLADSFTNGDGDRPVHEQLSDREFQTLRMIARGRKLSDIADEMALSAKTVSVYRARLLLKMRMKTNAELTRYAIENKLLE